MDKVWRYLRNPSVIAFFVFAVLSISYCHPIFKNITNWGIYDWDQHFLYHAVPRETVLRYHQFPLWTPYYCGGNVMLANMQARFMSPTSLVVLIFGTVIGLKLEIWLHILIAMMGMYLLSKKLGLGKYSSYLPPVLFMFSGMYVFHLTVGHTWFMAIAYLPFALLFYLKGMEKIKYGILSGAFIALMILEGGVYPAPHTTLLLVILSILFSLKLKSLAPLKVLGITILFTFLFSAVKLVPTLEFFRDYPRLVESVDHLSPRMLYNILFSRTQNTDVRYAGIQMHGWWEYGSYLGGAPVIMWLVGSVIAFRKRWPLIITGLVFLVLALGDFGRLSPWHLLHRAPVFGSHHAPSRFMIGFVFSVSIFAGISLTKLETYVSENPKWKRLGIVFCVLLMTFICLDLMMVNSGIFAEAFPHTAPGIERNENFTQIFGHHHKMYPAFLRNEGTLNAYEPTHFPTKAIANTDPKYRGEVFLTGAGNATITHWSPNKITVKVEARSNGSLTLNQNFAPNWKASNGKKVESYNGLISTAVTPEDEQVTFYYLPMSFIAGSVITLIGIALSVFVWRREKL